MSLRAVVASTTTTKTSFSAFFSPNCTFCLIIMHLCYFLQKNTQKLRKKTHFFPLRYTHTETETLCMTSSCIRPNKSSLDLSLFLSFAFYLQIFCISQCAYRTLYSNVFFITSYVKDKIKLLHSDLLCRIWFS